MIDICAYAVTTGEALGADEVEAVWIKDITTSVEAELRDICKTLKKRREGIRIRALKDKALGSAFTYRMDKDGIKTAVKNAVAAARASKKDEHWDSLPSPGPYPRVDVWDSTLGTVDAEDIIRSVAEIVEMAPESIAVPLAVHEVELSHRGCVNSSGIEHEDKRALDVYGMVAVGELDDGVTPEFIRVSFARTYGPDPHKIIDPLVDEINLFKNLDTAASARVPVVFSPETLQDLLYSTLAQALSGENVARGKSLLAEKKGEKIGSSLLTLHDNGLIREGTGSCEMDDEGVPHQDTLLIEEGVLKEFLWNDYWANRMGCSSTGNAFFSQRTNQMSIQQTNTVIEPGDYKKEELLDISEGYYVLRVQGAHGANPESGDFSVVCAPAYRIRNGEISGGCVGMMISDNIFSLLSRIDAVGCDSEVMESAILPHVRVTDVNVVAQ